MFQFCALWLPGRCCRHAADRRAGRWATSSSPTPTPAASRVSPSISVSGTNLVFGVTGTYALTLPGTGSPFVSVTMPAFSVPIPSTTRWGSLPEALAGGFTTAAQFARDLLNPPDKIAMFLAMVIGPQAAGGALELVCNALVDGAATATAPRSSRTATLIVSMRARRLQREGWERWRVGT
jgi:hypothetical protein